MAGSALAATLAGSTQAHAGAFGLSEQSAAGQGSSFAGVAAGSAQARLHVIWNPATITMMPGIQFETDLCADLALPPKFTPGGRFVCSLILIIRRSGAWRRTQRCPPAMAPGRSTKGSGSATASPRRSGWPQSPTPPSPAAPMATRQKSARSTSRPTAAWRVNDWLSVGAGRSDHVLQGPLMSFVHNGPRARARSWGWTATASASAIPPGPDAHSHGGHHHRPGLPFRRSGAAGRDVPGLDRGTPFIPVAAPSMPMRSCRSR